MCQPQAGGGRRGTPLRGRGVTEAVTVNGLLDPLSRAEAIGRVTDGSASLLYISPEMLRSKTVEKLLLSRNVVRFVIDEAHCFSAPPGNGRPPAKREANHLDT